MELPSEACGWEGLEGVARSVGDLLTDHDELRGLVSELHSDGAGFEHALAATVADLHPEVPWTAHIESVDDLMGDEVGRMVLGLVAQRADRVYVAHPDVRDLLRDSLQRAGGDAGLVDRWDRVAQLLEPQVTLVDGLAD